MLFSKSQVNSNETKAQDVCLLLQLSACIAHLFSSDIIRYTAYCVNGFIFIFILF